MNYDRGLLNRISASVCKTCSYKYWEACTGPHIEWNTICCKKVRDLYNILKEK